MITKFSSIVGFGSFSNFDWDSSVKDNGNNVASFSKLNIIYGRNYSGKTTLSRVLRSYKKKEIHEDYPNAKFKICDSEHGDFSECDLQSCAVDIRVYNSDFVNENLKLLRDKNGKIQPFAVVGSKNVEVEKQIESLETEIGNDEFGLTKDFNLATANHKSKKDQAAAAQKKLDDKLKEKARTIKNNATKYNVPTYTIVSIRQDIAKVKGGSYLLSAETLAEKEQVILEEAKASLASIPVVSPQYDSLSQKASEFISRVITPTESIAELLADPRLQAWVRDGIAHHKDKRKTCAFCSNPLPSELWDKLDAHFSKESEELRADINKLIAKFDIEISNFRDIKEISESSFYSELKSEYKSKHAQANEQFKNYRATLETVKTALAGREEDIFKEVEFELSEIDSEIIISAQNEINSIIENNNNLTATVGKKKAEARSSIRLHEVQEFINTIKYDGELNAITALEKEEGALKIIADGFGKQIRAKLAEVQNLKSELSDERKGAEQVNQYLRHYFGHNSLSLAAEEDDEGSKFVLMRGAEKASNLSEGECSLVAFCYFMAKLSDLGTNAQNTVIWIDDPISSLDSNHIFFAFSLIENVLAEPKNYRQLFISTHNLDFLKYLKRITRPKKQTSYFVLENDGGCSKLSVMPDYLKEYITEFNYIFSIIFKCAHEDMAAGDFDHYYNFGNNMRKFLESYLFYKYPNQDKIENKLKRMFNKDNIATTLANRINNEYCHLEHIFDRSMLPIDVAEMKSLAQYVLKTIEEADKDQYNALLISIGAASILERQQLSHPHPAPTEAKSLNTCPSTHVDMRLKSKPLILKVSKLHGERLHVEIPKKDRKDFQEGEHVVVEKVVLTSGRRWGQKTSIEVI